MKKLNIYLIAAISILMVSCALHAQNSKSYKIIVNNSSSIESITKKNVSKIFLKKTTIWDNGEKIFPIDLKTKKSVREIFSKDIHGKSVSAVKAYWRKQIFSGHSVPPVEKSSNSEILAYVKAKSGAIGYVSTNANTSGVKVVKISN